MSTKLDLPELLKKTKQSTPMLAQLSPAQRNDVLATLIKILKEQKEKIFTENKKDIIQAKKNGKNAAFIDRLSLTDKNFEAMVEQVEQIASSEDLLGETIEKKTIAGGVELKKIRVPLGIIAIIFESRPNVTVDVFALCFKSGNACVLKGGSDAILSNKALINCIWKALDIHGINKDVAVFLDTTDRTVVSQLLQQQEYIDVVIPRGGYDLVKKVANESKVPVLYHAAGGARIYIDKSADLEKALLICVNAKTSRPATCNSLDTVVIHEEIINEFLPQLIDKLEKYKVKILIDQNLDQNSKVKDQRYNLKLKTLNKAEEKDYQTEFLDYILAVKIVKNIDEAIDFITKHSKNHSEGIVAEDKLAIEKFVTLIDAAGIFVNCSTRLHDGGVFGLGAEMGISTGKLHARGPVGLRELTTYKWVAFGKGQIRK